MSMTESALTARLLPTPFVSSFIARARQGDLADSDPARRAFAWAYWAISNLSEMKGNSEREYAALMLQGKFYDPKNKHQGLHPHLEIPAHILGKPDSEFPDRLAQMGNGLAFPWWVMTEVTAVRRALFNRPSGSVGPFVEILNDRRLSLKEVLTQTSDMAASSWDIIHEKLMADGDLLNGDAINDFDTDEISDFFPPAKELGLRVVFDARLREGNKQWASRRVGVWQITGKEGHDAFALGVITPRLTVNSLFKDPLFVAAKESPAALLVRSLLLRRLIRNHIGTEVPGVIIPSALVKTPGGPYLRAIVAKMGAKMPQSSPEAAIRFLQAYPDPDAAWAVLERWADATYLLTVSKEGFVASHKNAARFLRREEAPLRDDINVILPLAWDQGPSPRVVRVTFARAPGEDSSSK